MQHPMVAPTQRAERGAGGRGIPVERMLVTSTEHGALLVASTLRTLPGPAGWYRLRTWHAVGELPTN